MSSSCKVKSRGTRRDKSRAPPKGVKRGGNKRKYQKRGQKSRKRDDANRHYRSHL